eukprot:TRINITY_DN1096_c0_g4_i1.p1 TRINITY_DN1096_c0_g4~~TRINITY_DN1096_c0_g4_i1.p1  ORF type:complete len:528 (+),score=152.07 TRINITY_DN1096_c0_g4_i1:71-1654(+)
MATKCIMRQLKQLQKQPVTGAAAAPCNDDLNEIHCNVIGQTGAYKGINVHFVLELQGDYPISPPNAWFVTPITYHGGAVNHDSKGRRSVCLNIFGNFKQFHGEWGSTNEGWSPAYTLETVLVQMQSLLSNDDRLLSTAKADVDSARNHAPTERCSCGHSTSDPSPAVTLEAAPRSISEHDNIVCYSSGATLDEDDALLGIGIEISNNGSLSTPGEVLSHEAFKRGVRQSSDNLKSFTHFLPLSHTSEHHERVKKADLLVASLEEIRKRQEGGKNPPAAGWVMHLVESAAVLMTSLVVEVAKRVDGTTSDSFIECYYTLLDTLNRVNDDERAAVTQHVDRVIQLFISDEGHRVKNKVPNLGVLLALLPFSRFSWKDLAEPLCAESDTRNFFWAAKGTFHQSAPYPELLDRNAAERPAKMFKASVVGRDLLCFQNLFSSLAKGVLQRAMSINDAKLAIKKGFAEVKKISSWDEYHSFQGLSRCSDHNNRLLLAMDRSQKCGYHSSKGGKKGGKGSKGYKSGKGGKGFKK